jgi:hypothetical protein
MPLSVGDFVTVLKIQKLFSYGYDHEVCSAKFFSSHMLSMP